METFTTEVQASNEMTDSAVTRRNFIKMGLGALSALAALEGGLATFFFLRARSVEGEFGKEIIAGSVASFPPGSVTEFAAERFFLVRDAGGGFLALYRRCPHLGCNIHWDEAAEHFYCPCHASRFDRFGNYDNAPVPRPLDLFGVRIANAQVIVDTTRSERRQQFDRGQLVYA